MADAESLVVGVSELATCMFALLLLLVVVVSSRNRGKRASKQVWLQWRRNTTATTNTRVNAHNVTPRVGSPPSQTRSFYSN